MLMICYGCLEEEGVVGVGDLLRMLGRRGIVGVGDLLRMLGIRGSCWCW